MSRGRHDPITDETVLETLATHASDDGTDLERAVCPSTIADALGRNHRTVSDRLSALANRGEIERTWRQTEHGPKPAYLPLEDDDPELVTDGGRPHDRDRQTTAGTDRVSYREADGVLERIDTLVDEGEFPNRSEAIRTATRRLVTESIATDGGTDDTFDTATLRDDETRDEDSHAARVERNLAMADDENGGEST